MTTQWVDCTMAELRGLVALDVSDSVLSHRVCLKLNDRSLVEQHFANSNQALVDDCDHLAALLTVEINRMRRTAEEIPAGSEIIARRVVCLEAAQIIATSTAWRLRP